jgi:hypothetical protein
MNETPVDTSNQKLKTTVIVVSVIAVLAIAFALYANGKKSSLEARLDSLTKQRDSLSLIVAEQTKLLESEGSQFQEDLLKIDSLQSK